MCPPPLQGVPTMVSNVFVVFLIKCKYVSKIDFKIPLQKYVYSYKPGSETNLVIHFKQKYYIPQCFVHSLKPGENIRSQHQVEVVKRKPQLWWFEILRTRSKDTEKENATQRTNSSAHIQKALPTSHPTLMDLRSPKSLRGWSQVRHTEEESAPSPGSLLYVHWGLPPFPRFMEAHTLLKALHREDVT